jgi:YgiT-type zinc finger domain-containing protein
MNENQCPMCGGIKEASTTSFTVDYKEGLVLVRDVPATVCLQCGEEWMGDEVASKLEEIVAVAKKQNQELFVARFSSYPLASKSSV